jgi:acetylornithine deacetylase/succinyl-diaminopimelate desuccinylase-like protein
MRLPADRELQAEATALLADLLRVDSSNPPGGETAAALVVRDYLASAGVECELIARRPARANLVGRLAGSGDGPTLALMGHTDVVPADARDWAHPPFSGHLDGDGYLWGRGALDMKNELATRAVAVAALARVGVRPRGDLLLIAESDEEDGSEQVGMPWLVEQRPDLRADYVLNEGAAERLELADGRTVVTVCIGEKAAGEVRITALGEAAATSTPHLGLNAVVVLARLIDRLAAYRSPRRVVPETGAMLELLVGEPSGDLDRDIEAAVALHPAFRELIEPLFATTYAPTRLRGSDALNVMPARASADVDCRPAPGAGWEDVEAELRQALGADLDYELEPATPIAGGTISPVDSPLYTACATALARIDPAAVLLPTLCVGFTDSHYMRAAFGSVAYGIWPMRTTPVELAATTVHGVDERVHVGDLGPAVRFHVEVARELLWR